MRTIVTTVFLFCLATIAAAEPATLTVHADRPGPQVSPLLYGIFFEDINLSADGGIYPELVRNRSFEDADKPEHWKLATEGTLKAEMAVDTERPRGEFDRRSLGLRIPPGGQGSVALVNEGYWGMAVAKGEQYHLAVIGRAADGFDGPLTFTLESANGKTTYAECQVAGFGADWTAAPEMTLTSSGTDPKARLAIRASNPGAVWFDYVSLLPAKTWKGHGLRPDLCEMLAALRPAFVRFPGGCWVEGDQMKFAYRWKTTIGDPSLRRTAYNIWAYQATNGLGHHEYLQMCEDLGAEPLFVVNCGMAHKDHVPMEKMGEFVEDALDAIEYANGPADSKWGSLRAKAGHPAPFNMKYIEVGNENGGPLYQERYRLFYDAIKAKYPKMTIVADERTTQRPAEIVDEHYYNNPEFFMANAGRYDKYDRRGPKIYVGEYAVTQNCGQGNLRGALGEAAFMTGMERNGDVVAMSSYAPLFVNANHRRWNPDLIVFDSSRAFGIPSYYVQKLFGTNRGDVVLPADLVAPTIDVASKSKGGAIGVGTWATQAEFKDLKVTQGDKVLFESRFANGLKGWKTSRGHWAVKDGALRQTSGETDVRATTGDKSWSDYTYTLKARKLGGAEGFLILFQVRDGRTKSWWNIGGWGNSRHAIEMPGVAEESVPGRIETGRWYDIRIELKGRRIRCYLDGKLIHDVSPTMKALYAVAGRAAATGEVVLKVVNVADAPQETQIDLLGLKGVVRSGTATVLTSADAEAENSLDQPLKVAPVTGPLSAAAASFRHTFPAHSLTVLRLKVE